MTTSLQPSQSQAVTIQLSGVNFALPGSLSLIGIATSQTNPEVADQDKASILITRTQGVAARLNPQSINLSGPGPATFLLLVENTGNVEGTYSATITSTSANVTANLIGLDGQPSQQIPRFILPAKSTGLLTLQANQSTVGDGNVAVEIMCVNTTGITATVTALIQRASVMVPEPPAFMLLLLMLFILGIFGIFYRCVRSGSNTG
ncbi:MAG: hypothetical protein AXA67_02435 [Methylothermaceae bacteria B42]|nr:MAG: hypothetical protein AXA67_02435 [Methylothermaceae bacteria B42]HHJ38115.1 hypothetical protein [Methylothermaceae bacterium]